MTSGSDGRSPAKRRAIGQKAARTKELLRLGRVPDLACTTCHEAQRAIGSYCRPCFAAYMRAYRAQRRLAARLSFTAEAV